MTQSDAPRVAISPETGLVDTPIETDEGAEAIMLLNPALQLGGILDIESASLTGSWKIVGLRHNADNWSGKFVSWCDLRELSRPSTKPTFLNREQKTSDQFHFSSETPSKKLKIFNYFRPFFISVCI